MATLLVSAAVCPAHLRWAIEICTECAHGCLHDPDGGDDSGPHGPASPVSPSGVVRRSRRRLFSVAAGARAEAAAESSSAAIDDKGAAAVGQSAATIAAWLRDVAAALSVAGSCVVVGLGGAFRAVARSASATDLAGVMAGEASDAPSTPEREAETSQGLLDSSFNSPVHASHAEPPRLPPMPPLDGALGGGSACEPHALGAAADALANAVLPEPTPRRWPAFIRDITDAGRGSASGSSGSGGEAEGADAGGSDGSDGGSAASSAYLTAVSCVEPARPRGGTS